MFGGGQKPVFIIGAHRSSALFKPITTSELAVDNLVKDYITVIERLNVPFVTYYQGMEISTVGNKITCSNKLPATFLSDTTSYSYDVRGIYLAVLPQGKSLVDTNDHILVAHDFVLKHDLSISREVKFKFEIEICLD